MQETFAKRFHPRAVFDGMYNVYAAQGNLKGDVGHIIFRVKTRFRWDFAQYEVLMGNSNPQNPNARPPPQYLVTLQESKKIDPL